MQAEAAMLVEAEPGAGMLIEEEAEARLITEEDARRDNSAHTNNSLEPYAGGSRRSEAGTSRRV